MKNLLLGCVCIVALFSVRAEALRFGAPPVVNVETKPLTTVISTENEALKKALQVHNLMTELPSLRMMAEQYDEVNRQAEKVQKYFDDLLACNEKRLGHFKNPSELLTKIRDKYRERTKNLDSNSFYDEGGIMPRSLSERNNLNAEKKKLELEVFQDLFANKGSLVKNMSEKEKKAVLKKMEANLQGTGLEALSLADDTLYNVQQVKFEMENSLSSIQRKFIDKLSDVGINMSAFDARNSDDMRNVRKFLQEKKQAYLAEAKLYIQKLDEQDKNNPRVIAAREKQSQNKEQVYADLQAQFPDVFSDVKNIDQYSPQKRQDVLIGAMEKDKHGTVFLTETNAFEVDQKMAEVEAGRDLVNTLKAQTQKRLDSIQSQLPVGQIDFSLCD